MRVQQQQQVSVQYIPPQQNQNIIYSNPRASNTNKNINQIFQQSANFSQMLSQQQQPSNIQNPQNLSNSANFTNKKQ